MSQLIEAGASTLDPGMNDDTWCIENSGTTFVALSQILLEQGEFLIHQDTVRQTWQADVTTCQLPPVVIKVDDLPCFASNLPVLFSDFYHTMAQREMQNYKWQ